MVGQNKVLFDRLNQAFLNNRTGKPFAKVSIFKFNSVQKFEKVYNCVQKKLSL